MQPKHKLTLVSNYCTTTTTTNKRQTGLDWVIFFFLYNLVQTLLFSAGSRMRDGMLTGMNVIFTCQVILGRCTEEKTQQESQQKKNLHLVNYSRARNDASLSLRFVIMWIKHRVRKPCTYVKCILCYDSVPPQMDKGRQTMHTNY